MEDQEGRVNSSGSAKEANVDEFPVSEGIAAVSMRLEPGSVRELHWHAHCRRMGLYAERPLPNYGVLARRDTLKLPIFGPGDVWYFPRGYPHSILSLGRRLPIHLTFDKRQVSEFGTFSLSDWVATLRRRFWRKILVCRRKRFSRSERRSVYRSRQSSGAVSADLPVGSQHTGSLTHKFSLESAGTRASSLADIYGCLAVECSHIDDDDRRHDDDPSRRYPWACTGIACRRVAILIAGKSRVTGFASHGHARTEEFGVGDIAYIPQGFGHYIENTGSEDLKLLLVFNQAITNRWTCPTGWPRTRRN